MTFDASEARNNHGEFGTTDVALKGPQQTGGASAAVTERPINVAAHKGAETPEEAQAQAVLVANGAKPLTGLPQTPIALEGQWYAPGPIGRLKDAELAHWARNIAAQDAERIHTAISLGLTAGEDNTDIAHRVIGSRRLNGSNGATEITRQHILRLGKGLLLKRKSRMSGA